MKKTYLSTGVLALAALLAGPAMAGDSPKGEGRHGLMRADTDGDGRVSKAEAAALHDKGQGEWFDKLDADKDGYLTQDEIRKARENRQPRDRAEMKAKMQEHFNQADANGDGKISLDEAQAKMPRLAERFQELDADKDGLLSKEELKRGAHKRRRSQG